MVVYCLCRGSPTAMGLVWAGSEKHRFFWLRLTSPELTHAKNKEHRRAVRSGARVQTFLGGLIFQLVCGVR